MKQNLCLGWVEIATCGLDPPRPDVTSHWWQILDVTSRWWQILDVTSRWWQMSNKCVPLFLHV